MQVNEADKIMARGMGIDLDDTTPLKAQLKTALAERDYAMEVLDQAITKLESARRGANYWRECWLWTFGALSVVLLVLVGTLVRL